MGKTIWSKELCLLEAQKYNTRNEFRNNNKNAYVASVRNKWINEMFSNLTEISNEEWKDIEKYEEYYQISNYGRVKSKRRNRLLTIRKDGSGYSMVCLCNGITQKNYKIHKLVANAFIPNPNNYKEINHIDEDKSNNKASNLEWCNRSYNVSYSIGKPIYQINKDTNEIINEFKTIAEVEKILNINHRHISDCCLGKRNSCHGYKWKFKESEKD